MQDLENSLDKDNPCFHIIAIGASAGGLAPLEKFFEHMPVDTGMAFVVIQHLSPDFKSQMEHLLARKTDMPIHRVENKTKVEPNNIYLIPPRKLMIINSGHLLITDKDASAHLTLPIDEFFRSLANDLGRQAVAVILSGTGADGSKGAMAISEAGGLVITQDADSAEFDAMPLNAIATSVVSLSIPPESMPESIIRYVNEALTPEMLSEQQVEPADSILANIFQLLKKHHDVDFSSYKLSTIGRRVKRRALLNSQKNLDDYIILLEENEGELNALYQDLLIGVTRFFRDKEMFHMLETQVIPNIITRSKDDDPIRIWVAACATGEEAYSIAMLFFEQLKASGKNNKLKIFATDIHQPSIKYAGIGIYKEEQIQDIPQKYRDKYLNKVEKGYSINHELRQCISFATHNLITDAPFTKLDFISCRNLLIYLQTNLQKKVLSLFHFGLKTNATLLLGSSETLGELADEFEEINSRFRLYTKKRDVRLPADSRFNLNTNALLPVTHSLQANSKAEHTLLKDRPLINVYDRLLDQFMPPSFLLDDKLLIVHIFGGGEKYLQLRSGRPSTYFLDLIADDVKASFSSAINHAVQKDTIVNYAGIRMQDAGGKMCSHKVSVQPINEQRSKNHYLFIKLTEQEVNFGEAPEETINLDVVTREHIQTLETELRYTQENLQATIEELETANEEMQASNEELVASNEELQSTNEELQSVNEELYTVNNEHQNKIFQLQQATDDMDNLLATTRVGVIFLDKALRIRRFTPEIARLFHLLPQDIGRSIEGFTHSINYDELLEKLHTAMETDSEFETETTDRKGNPYILRILPYRATYDAKPEGLLLTLIDIKLLKEAQGQLTQFKTISDHVSDCHFITDNKGQINYANRATLKATQYKSTQINTLSISEVFNEIDTQKIKSLFNTQTNKNIKPYESQLICKDGSSIDVEISLVLRKFNGKDSSLFISARDITERINNQRQLELVNRALESSNNGVIITDSTKEQKILYINKGFTDITGFKEEEILGKKCNFLQGEETDENAIDIIRKATKKGDPVKVQLLNYRKNKEKFWNDLQISPVENKKGQVINFVGVLSDITHKKQQEQAAREDANKIKLLLNSTAEGIYFINKEGICTFCNLSAAEHLGYKNTNELIGKSMHELIRNNDDNSDNSNCAIINSMLSGEKYTTDSEVFYKKNGEQFPVELWCHPIEEEDNIISGSVVTFIDITLRKRNEEQLKFLQLAAEDANKAKSVFLANVSHELRTPLTAIQGFTELLNHEIDDEVLLDKVNRIERNTFHLQDLLNDLLDLSRIESGFLTIEAEQCNLLDLITDIQSIISPKALEKQLSIVFEVLNEVPKIVSTDPIRFRQIIINLLNNAIKYTQEGGVTLTLRSIGSNDPAHSLLEVAVTDTGIGIQQEQRKNLFKPFFRADDAKVQALPGTGLGLSISTKLADQLGGSIDYDTTPNLGSQFRLTLPIQNQSLSVIKPTVLDHHEAEGRQAKVKYPQLNCNVYIVDDHKDIREYLRTTLEIFGCKIRLFEDGKDIVNHIKLHGKEIDDKQSIILMDINMPELDGKQATRLIREMGFDIPIIGITAGAMKGERERCLQAGLDDYLTKPVSRQLLIKKIANILNITSEPKNEENKNTTNIDADKNSENILLVDDNEDITSAFSSLLSAQGYTVKSLNSGEQALKYCKEFSPSIVILDISLPDISGFELIKKIQNYSGSDRMRFIAMTGYNDSKSKKRAAEAGFTNYLVKPVTLSMLTEVIDEAMETLI